MDAEFDGLGRLGRSTAAPLQIARRRIAGEIAEHRRHDWSVRACAALPISGEEVHDSDENNRADRGGCETVEEAPAHDA
jgi:hypothetical protein